MTTKMEKSSQKRNRFQSDGIQLKQKRNIWKEIKTHKILILMCLPAIIFFIVFNYCPLPGVYIAFTNFNYAKGIFGSDFIGFANFDFLISSNKLLMLTRNTVLYNLAFIILGNLLQITVAVLLNEVAAKWFRKITQTLMFLPYFISAVLVGLIVYNIFNSDYGLIPTVIRDLGGEAMSFYSTTWIWPIIIVLVNLWQGTGYGAVVYFATICGMDTGIMEAAEIDGANRWQRIRYITIPGLKSIAIILILFSIGGILKGNFGLFYNIIGPANSLLMPYTDIIETFVYRAMMNQQNFAQASAVGLYQSVFGFIIVMLANTIVKKVDSEYALF